MASQRALTSGVRCINCQSHVLRSFISSFSPVLQQISATKPVRQSTGQRRTFLSAPRSLRDQDSDVPNDTSTTKPFAALEGLEGAEDISPEEVEETNVSSVPWYLQDEEIPPRPQEEVNPMLERQRIPEIPTDSPPILAPLLKQISVDLGMDYLSVLDLRKLDPPPALGANLLMVVGSARSEKHLNVSADRLCRWLRTEYKLAPVADGLLGRNELKLKLRRKARRMKMLGTSAAADLTSADDGISTGWVCVNVGIVEDGKPIDDTDSTKEESKFVGFGRRSEGAKIVVQLMTEEKRSDVDLEGLWQGIFDRAMRKKAYDAEAQDAIDEEARIEMEEDAMRGGISDSNASKFSQKSGRRPSSSPAAIYPPPPRQHVRGFHTSSSRRHQADVSSLTASNNEMLDEFDLEPQLLDQAQTEIMADTPFTAISQGLSMKIQLDYLKQLPPSTALQVLGDGEKDRSSTTFLSSFYSGFPVFLETRHWESVLQLHCYALKIGHSGYSKRRLVKMLRDMQSATVKVPEAVFVTALEAIMLTPHGLDETSWVKGTKYDGINALRRSLGWAFEVIEAMSFHGYPVATEPVFAILHLAVTYPSFAPPKQARGSGLSADRPTPEPLFISAEDIKEQQYYVRKALHALWDEPSTNLYTLMLRSYVEQGNWAGFWDVWRSMARIVRSHTPEMYAIMFEGVAQTEHQAKCQETLTERIPEMPLENPPVVLEGEVAVAVKKCLEAAKVDIRKGFWADVWKKVSMTPSS